MPAAQKKQDTVKTAPTCKPIRLSTDISVRNLKPELKEFKAYDKQGGLYLLIKPVGGKYWRFDYRFDGKRKTLALGVYPDISLSEARIRYGDARKMIAHHEDPMQARKEAKEKSLANQDTFEVISKEWHERKSESWEDATSRKANEGLALLNKEIGKIQINELRTNQVVEALHTIEKRSPHMAAKCRQFVSAVVRYSIQRGKREEGKFLDLRGVLKALPESHFPSPVGKNKNELPRVIKLIDEFAERNIVSGSALRLVMLIFVRPGEIAGMKWSEIHSDQWKYWAGKTKTEHIVPLSKQSQKILKDLKQITGDGEYVFSSAISKARHVHRDSLSKALREMGLGGIVVTHGFRHLASTNLNEAGIDKDVIERQLSHKDSSIRGVYNHAQYMDERTKMMQKWANYIDKVRKTGVI